MAEHTPGPWEIREVAHEKTPYSKRRVYRVEIIAPQYLYGKRTHSRDIAQMVDYCEWTDHPANARLIAAAPELLAALIELSAQYAEMVREFDWTPCNCGEVIGICAHCRAVASVAKAEGLS